MITLAFNWVTEDGTWFTKQGGEVWIAIVLILLVVIGGLWWTS